MIDGLSELEIKDKKVLVRLDLNVPVHEGEILSDFRINKSIPTIINLLKNNNKVIILSHFGRPVEGQQDDSLSLKIIHKRLEKLVGQNITFSKDWIEGIDFGKNNILLCENVRFLIGEKENSESLAKKLATLADVFVFDAFGVSHRKEASTYGILNYMESYPGELLKNEIMNAQKLLSSSNKPVTTIISGAKISTKLALIKKLLSKSDNIILGGGILNTFLMAMKLEVGKSLAEKSFIDEAQEILNSNESRKIIVPIDVVVSYDAELDKSETKEISMIQSEDRISVSYTHLTLPTKA